MQSANSLRSKVESYRSEKTTNSESANIQLLLVAGPAGSGKDTIIKRLLDNHLFSHIVSHTTRPPRPGEQDGRDYYFVDNQTAEAMVDNRQFVEVQLVYDDYLFGVSWTELERIAQLNKIAVTDIDVAGAQTFMSNNPRTKAVFILPPSYEEWLSRLTARKSGESQEDITRRLRDAHNWLEQALRAGYWHFVVNQSLEAAVRDVTDFALDGKQATDKDAREERAWRLLGEFKRQINS